MQITPKAFDVLLELVRNHGRVVTKEPLLASVWPGTFVDDATLFQNVATLRRILGDTAGQAQFIATVPKLGYRFVADVRQSPADLPAPRRKLAWRPLAVVAAAVLALGVGVYLYQARPRAGTAVRSLAVLPFLNLSAIPEDEYLSDGLTEEITNAVAHIPEIRVAARTTAYQFKGSAPDIRSVGDQLKVEAVLEGSVRRDHDRIRVTAQLITTRDGYHLWSKTWDRNLVDLFAVQREIAEAIAVSVSPGSRAAIANMRPGTVNREAYNLYLKGRFQRARIEPGSLDKAIELFNSAIALDPGFALAYAALADCYADQGHIGLRPPRSAHSDATRAIRRALELDDSLSYAHSVQAFIYNHFDWDWESARRSLERAIELDPNDSHARHYYSHYLVSVGRLADSLRETRHALDLDPLDPRFLGHRTWHYLHEGNLPEALKSGGQLFEYYPQHPTNYYTVIVHEARGSFGEAVELRRSLEVGSGFPQILAEAVRKSGPAGYWKTQLASSLEAARTRYVSPYNIAVDYAQLGDANKAFEWLDRAVADRTSWLVYLRTDPRLVPLRNDPRFREVARRVGIPEHPPL